MNTSIFFGTFLATIAIKLRGGPPLHAGARIDPIFAIFFILCCFGLMMPFYLMTSSPSSEKSSYTKPSPQQKRLPVPTFIVVVIALVIVVVGISVVFVAEYHPDTTNQQGLDSFATGIAQLDAQETAQAAAQAERLTYPPFTHGAFFDSLKENISSMWDESLNCESGTDGYTVLLTSATNPQICLNTFAKWGEIAYQVTMIVDSGDCGGLAFRYVDANNYYDLVVCQDGSYNVGYVDHGTEHRRYSSMHSSSAILQGVGKTNVIAITVQGDTVNVFINRHQVDRISSQALMTKEFSQGQIGVLAYSSGGITPM